MKHWTEYTPFEWLMIDVASRYGMDKELNHVRIEWTKQLLPLIGIATSVGELTVLMQPYIDKADERPLFCGALLALWDAINGKESNWQVGQDAATSGPQLLSVLLKDPIGMRHTGVLGTNVPDAYTDITNVMNFKGVTRKVVKKGVVPHIYASEAAPKRVFKKAYPTFLKAYRKVLPKAQEASDFMVASWNSNALEHRWVLPDAGLSIVPVIVSKRVNMPCGKHRFEYIYEAIGAVKKGEQGTKSLSANTTHSYDAYMLRELNRRCNYNKANIQHCRNLLLRTRTTGNVPSTDHLLYLQELYHRFNQVSAVAFEYLDEANVHCIDDKYHAALLKLTEVILDKPSFEVTNIHDEFKTLPMYVTYMKLMYNLLLVESYYSNWWVETAKALSGKDVSFMANIPDDAIANEILLAEYSIG